MTSEVQEEILSQSVSQGSNDNSKDQSGTAEGGEKPKFGPWPDFKDPNFDFQKERKRLPSLLTWGRLKCPKSNNLGSWN